MSAKTINLSDLSIADLSVLIERLDKRLKSLPDYPTHQGIAEIRMEAQWQYNKAYYQLEVLMKSINYERKGNTDNPE